MDWDRLHTFLAVARAASFSGAARVLGRTQPAVSQAVAQLERELGQRLFLRDKRRIGLTPAGEVLLEHATSAFGELQRAEQHLAALAGFTAGRLVLGTTDTHACYVLPPVLQAFRVRFPGLELNLVNRPSPAIAELVEQRHVDVGFVTLPLPTRSARLLVEPLLSCESVAICAAGHALAKRARVTWDELAGYPLLLLHRDTASRRAIDEQLAQSHKPARVVMEMGSIEVIKRLVALDFGISIVPRLAVGREVAQGELAAVALARQPQRASLGLISHTAGTSPATQAFMNIARELLSSRRRLASEATPKRST